MGRFASELSEAGRCTQEPRQRGALGADTVGYDGSADVLTGGSGTDWFFFDPNATASPTTTDVTDTAETMTTTEVGEAVDRLRNYGTQGYSSSRESILPAGFVFFAGRYAPNWQDSRFR